MHNVFGFLKWEVRGICKNPQAYYFLALLTGMALVGFGYSWGSYLVIAMVVGSMLDLLFFLIKFRYRCFVKEQQHIINSLKQE